MKEEAPRKLRQMDRLSLGLLGKTILVGMAAGFFVVSYRIAIGWGDRCLRRILSCAQGHPLSMLLWFVCLILLAIVVGRIIMWEPMISGGGVSQVIDEAAGKIDQNWWKVLIGKIVGGFLALFAGLSLGRGGPSMQMGAMAGKGISRLFQSEKEEEKVLFACGAASGIAATFHAPLTGVCYTLEKVYKKFSIPFLAVLLLSVLAADAIVCVMAGDALVLGFEIPYILPVNGYWMAPVLGIFLGVLANLYNWMVQKTTALYNRPAWMTTVRKLWIPFVLAGVLGFSMPEVLGGGQSLLDPLAGGELILRTAVILFVVKLLYSVLSISSGVPGGIFFPVIVLGAMCGGIFALAGITYFGLPTDCVTYFVALGVAGYFSAVMKTPLTGVIMLLEMTGSCSQIFLLTVVSVVSYAVSEFMESHGVYDSMWDRLHRKK
ncbi:MAG: ClC family H(+)/Cl(-) exchange transporter [Lachnospiraceae bacterium]